MERIKHYVVILTLLLGPLLLVDCGQKATPKKEPSPTPDELEVYLRSVQDYTSVWVIASAEEKSPQELAAIIQALEATHPPAALAEAHALAIEAYGYIYEGVLIQPAFGEGELASEKYFLIDWGVSRLLEYRQMVDEYVTAQGKDKGR